MNELYHHGIKGMHWGVRRYQNPDGTLTDAGIKRYNQHTSDSEFYSKVAKKNRSDAASSLKNLHPAKAYTEWGSANALDSASRNEAKKAEKLIRSSERAQRKYAKQQRITNAKNSALLSDEELTQQILRLQREKQLKDLTSQTVAPGRKKALDLLDRYGNQMLATVVGAGASAAATVYVTNKINPRKSTYDTMLETEKAKKKLAKKGYRVKGYNPDGTAKVD